MKNKPLLLALLLLPLCAPAETLDLGSHGTFSIATPKGWAYSTNKSEDTGYGVMLTPPADVNARCVFSIVFVPPGETPSTKEDIQEKVLTIADRFVDQSVEKKKVLRTFNVPGAYGVYCLFTDASQVGQPTQKDVFKVLAIGIIRYNGDVSAAVSLMTDDANGPDFAAMLKAVEGATITARK